MRVRLLEIENFRGVAQGRVIFTDNTLLVGGNNVGKSSICEALDLVLGPERLNRRPVIDEHDFFQSRYVDEAGQPIPIVIRLVLTDLTDEARRRVGLHVRRWDDEACAFVDEEPGGADRADGPHVVWALPISFRGRYDRQEDDFEVDTFFDHGSRELSELDDDARASLGEGRDRFLRSHKRLCGFVFVRTLRTGSRALGLQRGSLLDTILRLGGDGSAEMWMETLQQMRDLDPAIGDVPDLLTIRNELRERLADFVNLAPGDESTAFFASDLTREHLREVVRLFIATGPSNHPVPFSRQGTGSINLLVFALLTMIADLKGNESVIFAMEEPEIALPPHTQRRVTRFIRDAMGQTIVTSHSPYVIEQFDPEDIVMLDRVLSGELRGVPIHPTGVKPKAYRTQRRQFAEAILSRAVLVVEGGTEACLLPVASSILEKDVTGYTHFDLAGVSIFTADGDGDVARWGPMFRGLGKVPFALFDKQPEPFGAEAQSDLRAFKRYWESPERGVEQLLVSGVPADVLRRFLDEVAARPDFPGDKAMYKAGLDDEALADIAMRVMKARKGDAWGYAAALVEQCRTRDELPAFLVEVLEEIDRILARVPDQDGSSLAEEEAVGVPEDQGGKWS